MTDTNIQSINWQPLNTPQKLKDWLDSSPDAEQAFEHMKEAYDSRDPSLHRWAAAAHLGDYTAYGFPEDFLQLRWNHEKLETDTDYYSEFAERVYSEIRKSFFDATGLEVLTEGRLAAGGEDADIEVDQEGRLESISDYWFAASNNTIWNVSFEYEDGPMATFEYVEGSYEEANEC